MADTDRGAYTPPTDAPLSFDARQPVRGSRPIPFTMIISALVLVGLVVAIVVFYRSGVREAGQPPQTVGASIGDMKSPAPAEAQPQDPAAGLQIYKAENAQPADDAPIFTAPPEEPQARPAPAPVVVAPPSAPVVAEPALRPAIKSSDTPPAKVVPPPAPKAAVVTPPPAPKVAPKSAPAPAVKAAAPAAGGAVVQIGAVSSTALADKAWSEAVAAAPGLAAGKGKSVEKIERNGGVLYRTAVTGFASRADAAAFCDRLKAAGKSCFVR
ncbi:SPOR domain-containing protein [Phenylobacterium sp.]|jgi:outer membrane biosynthesis protein TonB|uniref:cell division protein FtsN n=1 Tax=Phenylobacterium sp. TaxID=1871053 RepID=UPI002F95337D